MRRKGQAAMEFLMTYGWAILAAVIVVGVLWYLIGDPGNLAGNKFTVSSPFVSNAMSITAGAAGAGTIQLEFRNGQGEEVHVTAWKISPDCSTARVALATMVNITDGQIGSFTATCPLALTSGTKLGSDAIIYYTVGTGTVEQTATGSITGKVP